MPPGAQGLPEYAPAMSAMTKVKKVRNHCAQMPAADLEFPFGDETAVYKLGGKIFALATVDADPGFVTLKVDPDEAEILRRQYPFIREGYYMNKRHWITGDLSEAAPLALFEELVEDSYRLVAEGLTKIARINLGIDRP